MQKWMITPLKTPDIIRNCSKCGNKSIFVCSGNFRVNASGNSIIDVWLIYKCKNCDTTWNMEILSRVKFCQIDKKLYESFVKNDLETAKIFAFDKEIHKRNKAVADYDNIPYIIEKVYMDGHDDILEISSAFDLDLRMDKILSEGLNLSRSEIKSLLKNEDIKLKDRDYLSKTKIKKSVEFVFRDGLLNDNRKK